MKNNHEVDITLVFYFLAFTIIILGLFFKLAFQNKTTGEGRLISTSQIKKVQKKPSISLNYNNPILCNYQTKDSTISAMIEGNFIAATISNGGVVSNFIVNGDCLYSWNKGVFQGTKKCGIGNSIVMGKQLLNSGFGSIDSLIDMIPKTEKTQLIDFQAVFDSCKNVRGVDKELFVVPKSVGFK